jgi:hypothetical protein
MIVMIVVVATVCSLCHDAATAVIGKQWTRTEWELKITEMLQEEPDVTREERDAILEYLSTFFRPGGKIYVNRSSAKVLESARNYHAGCRKHCPVPGKERGDFKTIEDLRNVSGVDAAKLESKKDLLVF